MTDPSRAKPGVRINGRLLAPVDAVLTRSDVIHFIDPSANADGWIIRVFDWSKANESYRGKWVTISGEETITITPASDLDINCKPTK